MYKEFAVNFINSPFFVQRMRWSCSVTIYGVRSPDSGFRNPRTPESAQQACRQSRVVDCAPSQLLFLVFQMSFGHFTLMDISLCGPLLVAPHATKLPCGCHVISAFRTEVAPATAPHSNVAVLEGVQPKPNPNTIEKYTRKKGSH